MRGTWTRLLAGLTLISMGTGCVNPGETGDDPTLSGVNAVGRPTVVALIDSGINPYHEVFQAQPGGPRADSNPLGDAMILQLSSTGEYQDRVRHDRSVWDKLEREQLYAFAGTRVLGISMLEDSGERSILDGGIGHGTTTSSLIARMSPDVLIVMIQADASVCVTRDSGECSVNRTVAKAMEWAAEQPWIDIISVSIALHRPDDARVHAEMQPFIDASRRAHENGKIIVNGAGNLPTPTVYDYFPGPPWVIAAGGFEPNPNGSALQASLLVDVVANYTELLAEHDSVDGWKWSGGTSLSAPIVAATLGTALAQVRSNLSLEETPSFTLAAGAMANGQRLEITRDTLRDALNATATYVAPTDWDPTKPAAANDTLESLASQSLPVVAPAVQMGWGYVTVGLAEEIAVRVLAGDTEPPMEKADSARVQAQRQALREQYWSQFG